MKGKVIFMSSTNSSTELANGFGRVIGIGSYLPEKIMTNDDLSRIVETNDEWITERTGMRCTVADDADSCVAYGCGKSLGWINRMQEGPINFARRKLLKE